jgi:1-aminocyclopropane-1-carboxylate deaminase/D-cysteine desulfhydrase-like pyridoxal-dependent ACC family enzyme
MNTTVLTINDIRQFMKNSRMRKIFMPQRDKVRGNGNKWRKRRFMICTAYQVQST